MFSLFWKLTFSSITGRAHHQMFASVKYLALCSSMSGNTSEYRWKPVCKILHQAWGVRFPILISFKNKYLFLASWVFSEGLQNCRLLDTWDRGVSFGAGRHGLLCRAVAHPTEAIRAQGRMQNYLNGPLQFSVRKQIHVFRYNRRPLNSGPWPLLSSPIFPTVWIASPTNIK